MLYALRRANLLRQKNRRTAEWLSRNLIFINLLLRQALLQRLHMLP